MLHLERSEKRPQWLGEGKKSEVSRQKELRGNVFYYLLQEVRIQSMRPSHPQQEDSILRLCGQVDTHSLPLPFTSSARKGVLAHWLRLLCHHCLCHYLFHWPVLALPPPFWSYTPIFWCTGGCPGMLCRDTFFSHYGFLISCKSKGREKRNVSCHHDADITMRRLIRHDHIYTVNRVVF